MADEDIVDPGALYKKKTDEKADELDPASLYQKKSPAEQMGAGYRAPIEFAQGLGYGAARTTRNIADYFSPDPNAPKDPGQIPAWWPQFLRNAPQRGPMVAPNMATSLADAAANWEWLRNQAATPPSTLPERFGQIVGETVPMGWNPNLAGLAFEAKAARAAAEAQAAREAAETIDMTKPVTAVSQAQTELERANAALAKQKGYRYGQDVRGAADPTTAYRAGPRLETTEITPESQRRISREIVTGERQPQPPSYLENIPGWMDPNAPRQGASLEETMRQYNPRMWEKFVKQNKPDLTTAKQDVADAKASLKAAQTQAKGAKGPAEEILSPQDIRGMVPPELAKRDPELPNKVAQKMRDPEFLRRAEDLITRDPGAVKRVNDLVWGTAGGAATDPEHPVEGAVAGGIAGAGRAGIRALGEHKFLLGLGILSVAGAAGGATEGHFFGFHTPYILGSAAAAPIIAGATHLPAGVLGAGAGELARGAAPTLDELSRLIGYGQ